MVLERGIFLRQKLSFQLRPVDSLDQTASKSQVLEIKIRCLTLKANYKLAYRFVGVPDQCMKLSTFHKFELGRPGMTQQCFLYLCDGSIPQRFMIYQRFQ